MYITEGDLKVTGSRIFSPAVFLVTLKVMTFLRPIR